MYIIILAFVSFSFSNDMNVLHIGFNIQNSTCEDIEFDYDQLHTGEFSECSINEDCTSVWGNCDVGLGGCHYAVNEQIYNQDLVNQLVDLWLEGDCMEWVCDCLPLPGAVCVNNQCELAYCNEPNPAGCFEMGCPNGFECIDDPEYCVPSTCFCDEFWGDWFCTEDCGGGTCFEIESTIGDINNDSYINVLDVVQLINFILEIDYPTTNQFISADYNLDGMLNVLDVVSIVSEILNPIDSIHINSGTSYGECMGYCINELKIDNGNVEYLAEAWYESNQFPDLIIEDNLDEIVWSELVELIDFDYFMSLDDIYGCPDCSDGGAEWIEIIINGEDKIVIFDAYSEIEGIEELILLLREIRDNYYEQLFSPNQLPDECYLEPDSGPCFGYMPMYFYNTNTEQCEEFIWGGCMGLVPFQSLNDCQNTCE